MKKNPITIVTGQAGSGKSTALAAFEDSGCYCVDNMPVALLSQFLSLPAGNAGAFSGLVFGMDVRDSGFLLNYETVVNHLRQKQFRFRLIFLEADEATLVRRYSQTRRKHPLSIDKNLHDAIREEQILLTPLRDKADRIIDTSTLNVHELKTIVRKMATDITKNGAMQTEILSFGYKYGLPAQADLVMDVRFLKNPYFVETLRPLNGKTEKIRTFVLNNEQTCLFLRRYTDLLDILIPQYEAEGKAYLTIAIGCTGGRHRSVVIAKQIYDHIVASGRKAELAHRDIDKSISP
ncbi:nucleotide-binding protein [Desulfosarcina ovata subsp. ovata]|uniref:Nucleotide-binding protein n=1 Tax=Desulfosarcina ovata subsp. ovata TaxID=2752305 RepID=A0A5K8A302_9BACT|nr:nucleotide-binding protein [Desulfosarcina ovata subsp. ovata]